MCIVKYQKVKLERMECTEDVPLLLILFFYVPVQSHLSDSTVPSSVVINIFFWHTWHFIVQ